MLSPPEYKLHELSNLMKYMSWHTQVQNLLIESDRKVYFFVIESPLMNIKSWLILIFSLLFNKIITYPFFLFFNFGLSSITQLMSHVTKPYFLENRDTHFLWFNIFTVHYYFVVKKVDNNMEHAHFFSLNLFLCYVLSRSDDICLDSIVT